MRLFSLLFSVLFVSQLFITGCNQTPNYEANQHLTTDQQKHLAYSVMRYLGKLPGKANHQTKFNADFDDHYRALAESHKLDYYHKNDDGTAFFLFSRIAPSIKEKYVAIGGYVKFDAAQNIIDYAEVFRTWKMTPEELAPKSLLLFDLMVRGEDLSPYYTANSGNEEYIEFPDANTTYDKNQRLWVSTLEDYMEPLYRNFGNKDTATNHQTQEQI
jgi:hypothetical protein